MHCRNKGLPLLSLCFRYRAATHLQPWENHAISVTWSSNPSFSSSISHGCSPTSLQELWLVHEAVLQQCFAHQCEAHISDLPWKHAWAPSGHVCMCKICHLPGKGQVYEILHSSGGCLGLRVGSDLCRYFHLHNNKHNSDGIWEHSKFHALLRVSCNITDYYPSIFVGGVWKKEEGLLEIGF